MDAIALSLFNSRMEAVCEEMGAVLRRTAFSPNIRDRLDFSCAVFDAEGALCAQAAHIPVHLGSMAYAMRDIITQVEWAAGDMVLVNDPFLGGTHLPDLTLIAPLYGAGRLLGFVANRAHHADIGAASPGSMPLSRTLEEEGMVIPPTHLVRGGEPDEPYLADLCAGTGTPTTAHGDFSAQMSANRAGLQRLEELLARMGEEAYLEGLQALNDYAERLARTTLATIPPGSYRFTDLLDDDGAGNHDLAITVTARVTPECITFDFAGTAAQTDGNVNCPLSVAAAAVFYVLRCLMPPQTPACAGAFRPIRITAPAGSLLNARRPAAVAAGNVETSSRVVDVICGALAQALPEAIPAASHGGMNNLAMGARGATGQWDYYETMGGGMGAGSHGGGLSAVQTHMTNTLNTPIEVLEMNYPLRVTRYAVRYGSGGAGRRRGGDGLERTFEFLAPAQVTLLTERRRHVPWGLAGGEAARPGENRLNDRPVAGKVSLSVQPGDRLTVRTPGGGGWGREERS